MATNDFLPFATGGSANVLSQSAYAALSAIANGYSSGVAQSAALNKTWRQSSIMAAVLAQFISDRTGANSTDDGTTATLLANLKASMPMAHGQCRLSVSSATTLLLSPYNGNSVIVNGIPLVLPSAGVTYTASGLSASTKYYVYLGGTTASPSLSLSTTGYVTGTNGVTVMSGDATKTLVGMIYTTASTQFVDAAATRYCLNWFNRRKITGVVFANPNYTFSNTAGLAEINTSLRVFFLSWADDAPVISQAGSFQLSATGTIVSQCSVDTVANGYSPSQGLTLPSSYNGPFSSIGGIGSLSEGQHFTICCAYVNAGTATLTSIQTVVNVMG